MIRALVFLAGSVFLISAAAAGPQSVRVGVVPAVNVMATIEQYQPVVDYLGEHLSGGAELLPQPHYLSVLRKLEAGRLDIAVMGSYIAFRAIREDGAIPLARPVLHGDSTYEGIVFAAADAGVDRITDLNGKPFVSADRYTSAGYLYPRFLLRKAGHAPDGFFSEILFAGKHDAAILMVLAGDAPAGAAKDDVFRRLERSLPRVREELKVLHESDAAFPDRTVVARNGLDPALRDTLRRILVSMADTAAGRSALSRAGFERFIPTRQEDFGGVKRMLP